MLGSFRQLLGQAARENVWICSVNATPRVGTVNAQQFADARVFCCIRTQLRGGAEQGIAHLLNEHGWEPLSPPVCEVAEPSALPKPLRDLHKTALRDGEAIKIIPQQSSQPAPRPPV